MTRRPTHVPTPPRMRLAAMVCIVLGALVGVYSAAHAMQLGSIAKQRSEVADSPKWLPFQPEPALVEPLTKGKLAELAALEGMKTSRSLLLSVLAVLCAAIFVCAGRLLNAQRSMPREGLRRMLAGSLLVAAFLRTIVGAQDLVVAERHSAAMRPHLEAAGAQLTFGPAFADFLFLVMPVVVIAGITGFVVSAFVVLGQYFRSERVKQVVALQDQQLEQ